jgi:uncharacterized protein YdaU (DUF1376 family)
MASDRLLYFPVYVDETLSDERYQGWSCEERGAWFHLILMCYREGSIPASQDTLRRMLHLDAPAMANVWQAICDRFTASSDAPDRLVSPRVEREREKALRLMGVRSEAGEKGATARWDKRNKPHGKRIANACGRNAVPMANDAKQSRAEESREDQKQQRSGGFPTRDERRMEQYPGAASLRHRLAEEWPGLGWTKQADSDNAAVERCGLDACVAACLAHGRATRLTPESLGFFSTLLADLRPHPTSPPVAPSSPWWTRATPETLDRFERERAAIDPELRGAPQAALGAHHVEAIRALIARYETEARQ